MKNFSSWTALQRYAPSQRIAWLLRLNDGETEWLAATRRVVLDEAVYPARLSATPEWSMQSDSAWAPGGLVFTHAVVRVAGLFEDADLLQSWLSLRRPDGILAELMLAWLDDTESVDTDDAMMMLRGGIGDVAIEPAAVVLHLHDALHAARNKPIGRELTPALIGHEGSPSIGRVLPMVFGRHEAVPLLELRSAAQSRLAEPLLREGAVLQLASLEGFADRGVVQVGDETIEYNAVDAELATLGTTLEPIVRTQRWVMHSAGEPVRVIPDGGFQWLVADHPCKSVGAVKCDGAAVAPPWTASLRSFGEFEVQVVTMPQWPVQVRYQRTPHAESANDILGQNIYAPSSVNNALAWDAALDESTSSFALVGSGAAILSFEIDPVLGRQGPLVGIWSGATLAVSYSATAKWEAASHLMARCVRGEEVVEVEIPLPASDQAAAGIQELRVDLNAVIPPSLGWSALDSDPAVRIEVEFIPDADSTLIHIHRLEMRIAHFTRTTSEMGRVVTADVEGWMDDEDELIENPCDLIGLFLTHSRLAGFAGENIDADALDAIRASLEDAGYRFARRLTSAHGLGELLDQIARESGIWIRSGGELITFGQAGTAPDLTTVAELLDDSRALVAEAPLRLEAATSRVPACLNLITETSGAAARTVWTRTEPGASPSHPTTVKLLWLDGRQKRALADLGERLWAGLREPAVIYDQSYPPGTSMLEPGDAVFLERGPLALVEAPLWIEAAILGADNRTKLRMRGPHAGEFLWREDELNFLRVFGFGSRAILYVGGRAVMSIGLGGSVRLRGELTEEAVFSAEIPEQPVSRVSGFVYWSTPGDSGHVPFLRIDSDGNAALVGTLQENSSLEFEAEAAGLGADAERFWISPNRRDAGIQFLVDDQILHLAGELTENAFI